MGDHVRKRMIVLLPLLFCVTGVSAAHGRDILVFFDSSGSTRREVLMDYYKQYREVVGAMREGDTIACGLINANTRGTFAPFGSFSIRQKGTLESPSAYKEEVDRKRNGGLLVVKRVLSETIPSGNTDILSALGQAQTHFSRGTPGVGKNILVIFSDMVEETATLNLTKLLPKTVDNHYAKVKGMLPKLSNVKVLAAGVHGVSPKTYEALETFWRKVFAECSAECAFFGARLYDFGKWVN